MGFRHTRPHASHDDYPPTPGVLEIRLIWLCRAGIDQWLRTKRYPHIEAAPRLNAEKLRRRDARDRERGAVYRHCLASDGRIAAESLLPVAVADHGHRSCARPVVFSGNRAAENWLNAERLEIIARDELSMRQTRVSADTDVYVAEFGESENAGENAAGIRTNSFKDGIRKGGAGGAGLILIPSPVHVLHDRRPLGRGPVEDDQLLGIPDWQGFEEHRVHQAEDRCVCADAQRQGEDNGGGQARALGQHARRVTQILNQSFEQVPSAHVAAFLLDERGCAELA